MGLVINTNVASLAAQRQLHNNTNMVNGSFEKLASGMRINRAADDAAGLNISENLITQIRGNNKALSNAQDGVNILQIAEGALNVITENLQRVRELAIQAANDTNSSKERKAIAMEVQSRFDDINRIANSTTSNHLRLLDGTVGSQFRLQIGTGDNVTTDTVNIASAFAEATVSALNITTTVTVAASGAFVSNTTARSFLNEIDSALGKVQTQRSSIGAIQNRLQSTIENINVAVQNFSATNSRIRDLDVASETAKMTQAQILQQTALSVLSQANQAPQLAMRLIG